MRSMLPARQWNDTASASLPVMAPQLYSMRPLPSLSKEACRSLTSRSAYCARFWAITVGPPCSWYERHAASEMYCV
ncbi:hypothetical protein D3C74_327870 [compost metagenome]